MKPPTDEEVNKMLQAYEHPRALAREAIARRRQQQREFVTDAQKNNLGVVNTHDTQGAPTLDYWRVNQITNHK